MENKSIIQSESLTKILKELTEQLIMQADIENANRNSVMRTAADIFSHFVSISDFSDYKTKVAESRDCAANRGDVYKHGKR